MPVSIECPNGCRFSAPAAEIAQVMRCPSCRRALVISEQLDLSTYAAQFQDNHSSDGPFDALIRIETGGPKVHVEEFPPIELQTAALPVTTAATRRDLWTQRVTKRLRGRQEATRLFAWSLLVLSVITAFPPSVWIWEWSRSIDVQQTLPRWVYLSILLLSLQLFDAWLVRLIPDRSSLRGTGYFLLGGACLLAGIAAALVIQVPNHPVATWLQTPRSLQSRAALWCLALVCLHILLAFWAFRESFNWQRTEQLFHELFPETNDSAVTVPPRTA